MAELDDLFAGAGRDAPDLKPPRPPSPEGERLYDHMAQFVEGMDTPPTGLPNKGTRPDNGCAVVMVLLVVGIILTTGLALLLFLVKLVWKILLW